jgi:DnaJ-domain-containing protein 1
MKTNEEYRLLEQQLAEATKQNVLLRDALTQASNYIDVLGGCSKQHRQTLSATADLAGLVEAHLHQAIDQPAPHPTTLF